MRYDNRSNGVRLIRSTQQRTSVFFPSSNGSGTPVVSSASVSSTTPLFPALLPPPHYTTTSSLLLLRTALRGWAGAPSRPRLPPPALAVPHRRHRGTTSGNGGARGGGGPSSASPSAKALHAEQHGTAHPEKKLTMSLDGTWTIPDELAKKRLEKRKVYYESASAKVEGMGGNEIDMALLPPSPSGAPDSVVKPGMFPGVDKKMTLVMRSKLPALLVRDMFLKGTRYDAKAALRVGIVDYVVEVSSGTEAEIETALLSKTIGLFDKTLAPKTTPKNRRTIAVLKHELVRETVEVLTDGDGVASFRSGL